MSTDPRIVYGADRIGLRFAVKDALHPSGHHGQDYHLPAGGGSEVVAYEECVVVECGIQVTTGFTSMLGWYLVARAKSDGRYIGWAHLRRGTRAALGKTLMPGDRVGLAASGPLPKVALGPLEAGDDYPGTAWSAPHIHTTDSNTIPGIFAGNTIDPLPRIQSALTRLASTGTLIPIQEDDMTPEQAQKFEDLVIRVLDLHAAVGAGNARNIPAADQANASVLGNVRAAVSTGNAVLSRVSVVPTPADIAKAVWWDQTVERANADGTVSKIAAIQELADIKTTVLAPSTGGVDVDKLADAIAAKIPAQAAPVDVAGIVRAELARVFVSAQ